MNNAPMTITATRAVWLSEYHTPDELVSLLQAGNHQRACDIMSIYGPTDMDKFGSYVRIGEADVTVRLIPRDEQTRLAVDALNKKLGELREKYMQAQQEIMDRIQSLQALPMPDVIDAEPAVVHEVDDDLPF